MIPRNITREHVLAAIAEIDRNGVPENRTSRKFILKRNGRRYPPKYVLALANKHANGSELDPEGFEGGAPTNDFLRRLGFVISNCLGRWTACVATEFNPTSNSRSNPMFNE